MQVSFALMVHNVDDERVAHQEAAAVRKYGGSASIFSTYKMDEDRRSRENWLIERLVEAQTDVAVCDTPLAVLAACKARRAMKNKKLRVVYDVTEWYPSKKNLRGMSLPKRCVKFAVLSVLSVVAAAKADGFLFGEAYKAKPFRFFSPRKRYMMLPYYASEGMVRSFASKSSLEQSCVCYYSGNLTEEKGFFRVLEVVRRAAEARAATSFTLRVVTSSDFVACDHLPENMRVEFSPWSPFPDFCQTVGSADIYFDLRDDDFENTRCLPIKLFYYMAAGRPMIYSRLKAIPLGVPDFGQVGRLVSPRNVGEAVDALLLYVDNPDLYAEHCQNSVTLSTQKYNWTNFEKDFVDFLHRVE